MMNTIVESLRLKSTLEQAYRDIKRTKRLELLDEEYTYTLQLLCECRRKDKKRHKKLHQAAVKDMDWKVVYTQCQRDKALDRLKTETRISKASSITKAADEIIEGDLIEFSE